MLLKRCERDAPKILICPEKILIKIFKIWTNKSRFLPTIA
jgi:hypothetical protein